MIQGRVRRAVDILLGRTEHRRELEQKLNDAVDAVHSLRFQLHTEHLPPPRRTFDSIDVDWHEAPTSPGKV